MAVSFWYVSFCTVSSETTAVTATLPNVSVQSQTTNKSMYVATIVYNTNRPGSYGAAQKATLQLLMSYA